jgi:hypothetical protein
MNHSQPPLHNQEQVRPAQDAMDDTQTVLVSSHVIITDKSSGKILLNKRGS